MPWAQVPEICRQVSQKIEKYPNDQYDQIEAEALSVSDRRNEAFAGSLHIFSVVLIEKKPGRSTRHTGDRNRHDLVGDCGSPKRMGDRPRVIQRGPRINAVLKG